jgi:cytochrome c553
MRFVKSTRLVAALSALAGITTLAAFGRQTSFEVPAWLFPTSSPDYRSSIRNSDTSHHSLPGSSRTFTGRQIGDALNPPDWRPESHPQAPDVVTHARAELKYACGLCHLPDGQGRSENATAAGLPEAYFIQQMLDMRSGARAPAKEFASSARMKDVALAATDAEIAAAAKYFASIRPRKQYTVRESTIIPKSYQAGGLYALRPGSETEPLGDRMMEISDDIERHEMRDPGETFTVYVAPGTLAKGQRIALDAPATSPTRCAQCHGEDLRGLNSIKSGQPGVPAPPIAGRSPFYMLRQLAAFRTKTRNGTTSAPMQVVAAALSLDEMIAAVAYAGSRTP